jgi:hypothetical protein
VTDLRHQGGVAETAPRRRGATRVVPPETEAAARHATRPARVARGINAVVVGLCLLGSLQVLVMLGIELNRIVHAEREIARLEAELSAIDRESDDLLEVATRAGDVVYREQLARRQGYVYPFETRYIGPQPAP